jgi:hypothetical protein
VNVPSCSANVVAGSTKSAPRTAALALAVTAMKRSRPRAKLAPPLVAGIAQHDDTPPPRAGASAR